MNRDGDDARLFDCGEDHGRPAAVEPVAAADREVEVDGERLRQADEDRRRRRRESRGRQLDNLRPQEAAIRHGVYARQGVYMRCDQCPLREECPDIQEGGYCRWEQQYIERRMAELYELEWIDPVIDAPMVRTVAWLEVRIERAARYIAQRGEIGDGQYVPVAKDIQGLLNTWGRALKDLGITPPERKAMAATGQGALGELAEALLGRRGRVVEETREEIADAEFTVDDVEQDGQDGEDGNGQGDSPQRHRDTENGEEG